MSAASDNSQGFDRYQLTPLLRDKLERPYYDLWVRPSGVNMLLENATKRTITQYDVGRLDKMAYDAYQSQSLWWVIALVNNYINPITDMVVGKTVIVPKYDRVLSWINTNGQ